MRTGMTLKLLADRPNVDECRLHFRCFMMPLSAPHVPPRHARDSGRPSSMYSLHGTSVCSVLHQPAAVLVLQSRMRFRITVRIQSCATALFQLQALLHATWALFRRLICRRSDFVFNQQRPGLYLGIPHLDGYR